MATIFMGTRFARRQPIVQSKVTHPVGAPQRTVNLPAAGGTHVPTVTRYGGGAVNVAKSNLRRPPQAFVRTLTAKPVLVPPSLSQRVGNASAPTDSQSRGKTAGRRQIAVRRTPGRVPNGAIRGISTSAGRYVFVSPAGRSTVTGIVHIPPQPLVPVLAARLSKSKGML